MAFRIFYFIHYIHQILHQQVLISDNVSIWDNKIYLKLFVYLIYKPF